MKRLWQRPVATLAVRRRCDRNSCRTGWPRSVLEGSLEILSLSFASTRFYDGVVLSPNSWESAASARMRDLCKNVKQRRDGNVAGPGIDPLE
jgi:hypothetical protein